MLQKLKDRWKVNTLNLILIISTFAIGGSLCGKAGAKLLDLFGFEKNFSYWIIYLILVTLLWPLFVIAISIPLGQFVFFKNYLRHIWQRISGNHKKLIKVAIFASGGGSNAQKIIDYFKSNSSAKISLIVCNKKVAGVLDIAVKEKIPSLVIEKNKFFEEDNYLPFLNEMGIDFIVLAGFLWKMPKAIITNYPNKIINIHPALLPKYGGKGMYGQRVHEAVIEAKDAVSGITIHFVDEFYDHGNIIFQSTCSINETDTAQSLAQKIHQLEHMHYPVVIEDVLQKLK
jgi:formyltetrahydrofolate-dependent phosphoribosylglycinamide formyltransferase